MNAMVKTLDGLALFMLNRNLLERQKISKTELQELKEVHQFRLVLLTMMNDTNDRFVLADLAQDVTLCDYELQRIWKFDQNIKFHRFWNLPKCKCPKLDNDDRYPSGFYVKSFGCPIHGLGDRIYE